MPGASCSSPSSWVRTPSPSNPPPQELCRAHRQASHRTGDERDLRRHDRQRPHGQAALWHLNPVRTGGPMQGERRLCRSQRPWLPLSREGVHRHEVFTRRAHLVWHQTHLRLSRRLPGYPLSLRRLQCGWYASRNAPSRRR
ncbi:DUF1615 family protein [Aeromonas caviae]|uniref:DUF1615 family protein n=1 Tax=Aeromonas caviae TaxID=648 RepID=UPI003C2FF759